MSAYFFFGWWCLSSCRFRFSPPFTFHFSFCTFSQITFILCLLCSYSLLYNADGFSHKCFRRIAFATYRLLIKNLLKKTCWTFSFPPRDTTRRRRRKGLCSTLLIPTLTRVELNNRVHDDECRFMHQLEPLCQTASAKHICGEVKLNGFTLKAKLKTLSRFLWIRPPDSLFFTGSFIKVKQRLQICNWMSSEWTDL